MPPDHEEGGARHRPSYDLGEQRITVAPVPTRAGELESLEDLVAALLPLGRLLDDDIEIAGQVDPGRMDLYR